MSSIAVCSMMLAAFACRGDNGGGGAGTDSTNETSSGSSGSTEGTSTSDGETTSGWHTSDTGSSTSAPECGNGVVEASEECDDGNAESLDGCEPDCTASSGLEIWTLTHDGPANGDDWIYAIAAAPDDTMVLAGYQSVETEDINIWVRKMNTDGEEVWTVSRDVGASVGIDTPDRLAAVAVDADGNIAVTGQVQVDQDTDDWDIWTALYDPDGVELWTDSYAGSDAGNDLGMGVAFDADGNVIIVGDTETIAQGSDALMRKLDPDGQELWTQTYNGSADGDEAYGDVITDGATIIIVGAETGESTYWELVLVAHDADGNELWRTNEVNELDSHMMGHGVALDGDGNIHVSGRADQGDDSYDVWLAKYESGGQLIWKNTWNGVESDFDSGFDIAVADAGTVFIAGVTVYQGQEDDILAASWDGDGRERWAHSHDGPASVADYGSGVAVDADGFVYVVGCETALSENHNGWIRKYYP